MSQKAIVKLYKKNPCPFCDRAINFFNSRGVVFETIDLTNNPEGLQAIKDQWGWKTVPIIVINDQLIGGYNDLKALDEEGGFAPLLEKG
ncbi:MAG: glutaredoxin domain-containing protein [Pseudobdellovibrionaceae bacterium]